MIPTTPNTPANGGQILTDEREAFLLLCEALGIQATACAHLEGARLKAEIAELRASLAAPAIPTVDRNSVLEEAAKACEEFNMHGMALTIRELKSAAPVSVPATAKQSICHDTRFMDALDGYMDAVTNEPRNTDRRVKQRLEIFAAADAWRATPATVKTAEGDEPDDESRADEDWFFHPNDD